MNRLSLKFFLSLLFALFVFNAPVFALDMPDIGDAGLSEGSFATTLELIQDGDFIRDADISPADLLNTLETEGPKGVLNELASNPGFTQAVTSLDTDSGYQNIGNFKAADQQVILSAALRVAEYKYAGADNVDTVNEMQASLNELLTLRKTNPDIAITGDVGQLQGLIRDHAVAESNIQKLSETFSDDLNAKLDSQYEVSDSQLLTEAQELSSYQKMIATIKAKIASFFTTTRTISPQDIDQITLNYKNEIVVYDITDGKIEGKTSYENINGARGKALNVTTYPDPLDLNSLIGELQRTSGSISYRTTVDTFLTRTQKLAEYSFYKNKDPISLSQNGQLSIQTLNSAYGSVLDRWLASNSDLTAKPLTDLSPEQIQNKINALKTANKYYEGLAKDGEQHSALAKRSRARVNRNNAAITQLQKQLQSSTTAANPDLFRTTHQTDENQNNIYMENSLGFIK